MSIQPYDGNWYVVTTCGNCQDTIFLFRDLTNGTGSLNATYVVTCPHCLQKGPHEGRHYQHVDGSTKDEVAG